MCSPLSTSSPSRCSSSRSKSFAKVGDGVEEQPDHRAYRMLHDMPNPFTPAHRFWSTVCVHELLWGNWFIEKLRGQDGLVNELRLVHPATVEVMFSEQAGFKRFKVTRSDGTQTQPLGPDRILHGFGLSQGRPCRHVPDPAGPRVAGRVARRGNGSRARYTASGPTSPG